MKEASITEARRELEALLKHIAETGEPVVLTRYHTPVAKLVPLDWRPVSVVEATHFGGAPVPSGRWEAKISQERRDMMLNAINKGRKAEK